MGSNQIILIGVSCVGKTTIGKALANKLNIPFYDLDTEIEKYFAMPISAVQDKVHTAMGYRKKTLPVIKKIVASNQNSDFVLALFPSGLNDCYWTYLKDTDCRIIVLDDSTENILSRLVFYDDHSKKIDYIIPEDKREAYLARIKEDQARYAKTYKRASIKVGINGLSVEASVEKIVNCL